MTIILLAIILCFLMTWGVGANDLANVMSTTMGSKAVTVRTAIAIAIVFEFAGAFLGGAHVVETMKDGIINTQLLTDQPQIMILGMLSVLTACTIWMNLASFFGVPVSITNALVGSVVGYGALALGTDAVHWSQVSHIAIGWITSPLIAGLTSYALFISIQSTIFVAPDPLRRAEWMMPIYLFITGLVLAYMIILKGLTHFNIHYSFIMGLMISFTCSGIITLIGIIILYRLPEKNLQKRRERFDQVEKYFAILMAMTACIMVFAHGSNDVALATSPLNQIFSYSKTKMVFFDAKHLTSITLLFGCVGVVAGFMIYGRKVIETVGSGITALTPSRAFAATLSAATTVIIANTLGLPVSATQTLVGAVLGVGLARGIGALNLVVIRNIFMSWIITLPAASLMSLIIFKLLMYFLPHYQHLF
ncbi:MAG TPA: phosphate permease [Legionellales bacterium]|nr:phosphate permease [Legionellales bacterium]